jgi:hypothetical protein
MHPRITDATRRAFLAAGTGAIVSAAGKPNNKMRLAETKGEKVAVFCGDQPILEYRYTPARPKTYVHPLYAPNGFVVSYDSPPDHVHHQGLMLAWSNVNGVDFWGEKNPGKHGPIVHQRWLKRQAHPAVTLAALNHWVADGRVLVVERQTIRVSPPSADFLLMEWESELEAGQGTVKLDASGHPYDGLGVRFPHSMDLGRCLNSNGTAEIQKANGEAATWCTYYGSMGEGKGVAGLAMFDDPANPRHPTPFFVMNRFGYLTAAPTFYKPLDVKPGEKLRFRWGVVTYIGEPDRARMDSWYKQWTAKRS